MTAPGPIRLTLMDCPQHPAPGIIQPDTNRRPKVLRSRVAGTLKTLRVLTEAALPLRVRLP